MRLGKDVLEADLYGELGVLPDASIAEIRVAYRRKVRGSHPDLNQEDPDAMPRMTRLNMAARVLLDAELRRAYDRRPPGPSRSRARAKSTQQPAWFERRERAHDNDWAVPPKAAVLEHRSHFAGFFRELRGRDGQLSLHLQELLESLSARQQIAVAALLCAVALGLIVVAAPKGLIGDSRQPTSVNPAMLYP